ncbi:MAG: Imm26 family immunity protein [bacterium]|nr:Imm26 family immunity protein [bacterium]
MNLQSKVNSWLKIDFDYGKENIADLNKYQSELENIVNSSGLGDVDGHEVATDLSEGTYWIICADAMQVFNLIKESLLKTALVKVKKIEKRDEGEGTYTEIFPRRVTAVKKVKKKICEWKEGDYFLIPLSDGSFGVGQVIYKETRGGRAKNGSPYVGLFSTHVSGVTEFEREKSNLENSDSHLASVLLTIGTRLTDCLWTIVGSGVLRNIEKYINIQLLKDNNYIGETSYTDGISVDFLEAYNGLKPWDMYFEPDYFDKLLISSDKKPKNLIYSKVKK